MLVRLHIITKKRGIVGYFVKLINIVPLPSNLLSKRAKIKESICFVYVPN